MKKLNAIDGLKYTMNAVAGLWWTLLYYALNEHVSDAVNYWLLNKIHGRAMWCVETEPYATMLSEQPVNLYNIMFVIEFTEDEMVELLMKKL